MLSFPRTRSAGRSAPRWAAVSFAFGFGCVQLLAQATGTLSGTVEDASTHRPIARVLVTVPGQTPVLTDRDGHFAFEDMPAGTTQFVCRRPDYFDPLTLQPLAPQTVTITSPATPVTLGLLQGATLHGQVTAPDGDSPDGVRVRLYGARILENNGRFVWESRDEQTVDADGSFVFSGLPPGNYAVHAEGSLDPAPEGDNALAVRSGYGPAWSPAAGDLGAATILSLAPGGSGEADITLERRTFYPVRMPLSLGARPSCQASGNGFRDWPFRSERRSEAMLTELPPGNYTVRCRSGSVSMAGLERLPSGVGNGVITQMTIADAPAGGALELPLHVGAAPVTTAPLTFAPAPIVQLTLEQAGNAAEGSSPRLQQLMLERSDDQMGTPHFLPVHYDDAGNASIDGTVDPGSYWVTAMVIQGYASSLTAGGSNLFEAPLEVGGSSPVALQAAIAGSGGSLTVALTGELLQSASEVQVIPTGSGVASVKGVQPGTSTVSFAQLAPGNYRVLATQTGAQIAFRESGVLAALDGVPVSVTDGQTAGVSLTHYTTPPANALGLP